MKEQSNIQFIRRNQIDAVKWDQCIKSADNGLIYAYTFYLDHMAVEWDGLVMGDYEYVMPLPWKKKYGVRYLTQPFLTAQLGVFGKKLSAPVTEQFLLCIPTNFKYWDLYLNHGNVFSLDKFQLYERMNFVLDLSPAYEELYRHYRENIQRNIKKAYQVGCTVTKDLNIEMVISLAADQMKNMGQGVNENINRFRKLFQLLEVKRMAKLYGILSAKKEIIASCVFFLSHNRAYYILVGNHPDGRTIGASHALIDAFIRDHARQPLLLDFEGSDIRNLAFFYSSFGAKEEKYAAIKLNRLPFYIKWFKK